MKKLLVVCCAVLGAYSIGKAWMHWSDVYCYVAMVVVGVCGFGLSGD